MSHMSCSKLLICPIPLIRKALNPRQKACRKLVVPEELTPNECGLMLFVSTAVMLATALQLDSNDGIDYI
jgi:hypothetical protein